MADDREGLVTDRATRLYVAAAVALPGAIYAVWLLDAYARFRATWGGPSPGGWWLP